MSKNIICNDCLHNLNKDKENPLINIDVFKDMFGLVSPECSLSLNPIDNECNLYINEKKNR